ncbi:HAD-like protein [Dentipellis sp. KUC8613]|nr:HAD-like protein [Dentipellis sp. KUC8613]
MPSLVVDAVLFDMDGTLIDSTPGVITAWDAFAREYKFDGAAAAEAGHGRRLADTLGEYCRISDPATLEKEIMRFEEEVIEGGPVSLPGAVELLNQISAGASDAAPGWTIVTSATSVYTPKALARCSIPLPRAGYVTSNDVAKGKPHPDPYLAGAQRVRADPAKCVVVEDAPSGLFAGHAAGAKVIAVCTSHSRDAIVASGAKPDFIVKDLTRVKARWEDGRVVLEIDDSLW